MSKPRRNDFVRERTGELTRIAETSPGWVYLDAHQGAGLASGAGRPSVPMDRLTLTQEKVRRRIGGRTRTCRVWEEAVELPPIEEQMKNLEVVDQLPGPVTFLVEED